MGERRGGGRGEWKGKMGRRATFDVELKGIKVPVVWICGDDVEVRADKRNIGCLWVGAAPRQEETSDSGQGQSSVGQPRD